MFSGMFWTAATMLCFGVVDPPVREVGAASPTGAGITTSTPAHAAGSELAPLWLRPDRFDARAGEDVSVRLERLWAAQAVPVAPKSVKWEWAFVRLRGVQENRDTLAGLAAVPQRNEAAKEPGRAAGDEEPAAGDDGVRVELWSDGVAMIACDGAATVKVEDAGVVRDALRARLRASVYDEVAAAIGQKAQVRVRRIETAKCLVHVLKAGGEVGTSDSQNVITKAGQVNEIRFTMDPTRAMIGSDVSLRVFADFDKSARAKVIATCEEAGTTHEIEVDGSATGYLTLTHAGTWRVQFAVVKILQDDPEADMVLYAATAMFKTMPGQEAAKPEVVKSGPKEAAR